VVEAADDTLNRYLVFVPSVGTVTVMTLPPFTVTSVREPDVEQGIVSGKGVPDEADTANVVDVGAPYSSIWQTMGSITGKPLAGLTLTSAGDADKAKVFGWTSALTTPASIDISSIHAIPKPISTCFSCAIFSPYT
jgi:hypothetical protein